MLTPKRIQQRRVKGWRMPANTVSVTRPHRWGNPFRIGTDDGGRTVVRDAQGVVVARALSIAEARRAAVDLHRASITPELAAEIRQHLAGKNLACFCPLTDACHADTLLEIANGDRS